jgi:DNA-binding transcriptional LysR family regulator
MCGGLPILNSSLRRLNVFRVVVDCGGVNAAADHLGIAQPSVTAHLHALEKQLGATLFLRSRGRRNVITPTGETLYKYACDALARSAELQSAVKRFDASAAQSASIAVQRALANYMLPRVLAPFLRGRPSARMSVYSETQEAALELFRAGGIDAALVFATPETEEYHGRIIGAERLRIVAAPSHPLAQRKQVPLAELEHFDFVGALADSQFSALVKAKLKAGGLQKYRVILHMQDSVAIKNAAVHGIGLACTLSCVLQQEIAEGKLVVIETDPAPPPVPVKLLVRPDALCLDFIEAFIPSLVEGLRP